MAKSKKLRQKWWKELSDEDKAAYIDKKVLAKAIKRRKRSLRIMKNFGDKYSCKKCFHRLTKSCTDDLPNGCEFWWNPYKARVVI